MTRHLPPPFAAAVVGEGLVAVAIAFGYEPLDVFGDVEFPGMEDRPVEFWASTDEYWGAVGGSGPSRPY